MCILGAIMEIPVSNLLERYCLLVSIMLHASKERERERESEEHKQISLQVYTCIHIYIYVYTYSNSLCLRMQFESLGCRPEGSKPKTIGTSTAHKGIPVSP